MKKVLMMLAVLFLMAGCNEKNKKNKSSVDPGNTEETNKVISGENKNEKEVMIRLINSSGKNFQNIRLMLPEDELTFDKLAAGESTDFQKVNKAYRYAGIKLEVDGQDYEIRPVDYISETPLEAGKHTYELNFDTQAATKNEKLKLSLKK